MATDVTRIGFNAATVDVVAVQGTLNGTDRAGASRAAGEYTIGAIPKGAIIKAVYLNVTTAFDGTTPTVALGVPGTADKFIGATSVATTGLTAASGTAGLDTIQATTEDLIMTLVSSDNTVGEVSGYVEYIDTAARREMFTV